MNLDLRCCQWAAELKCVWGYCCRWPVFLSGCGRVQVSRCVLYFPGLILLVVGIYLHLRDAWHRGRPGYPTKVGVLLFVGGIGLAFDVMYREAVDGPLHVHPIAPMVGAIGAVVLLGRLWRPPRCCKRPPRPIRGLAQISFASPTYCFRRSLLRVS